MGDATVAQVSAQARRSGRDGAGRGRCARPRHQHRCVQVRPRWCGDERRAGGRRLRHRHDDDAGRARRSRAADDEGRREPRAQAAPPETSGRSRAPADHRDSRGRVAMADPLGSYTFLPWLRRGLATEIVRVDGTPSTDAHAPLPVALTFNASASLVATAPLALLGPGEVKGLDSDAIIRVAPLPNVYDVEPNYFPLVEFDQPDLPWRYTPARATSADRLRPWLCLIVVREDEIKSFDESVTDGRLRVLTVKDAASLPLLDQSWAWVHVQVAGAGSGALDAAALKPLLSTSPERVISRLLSPRRLDNNARYLACLVPTFEQSRLRGLREPVVGDAMAPAWTNTQLDVRL